MVNLGFWVDFVLKTTKMKLPLHDLLIVKATAPPCERNDPIIFAFISHTEMADTILGGSPDLNSSHLFPSQIENNPMDMNKHSLIQ